MANENQLRALEQRVEGMVRDMRTMWQQIKAALQQVRGAYSNGPTNQGSSGGGMYYCAPSGSIPAASGVPGVGGLAFPQTANVYKITSGAYVLVASSASIYNAMLSGTTAGRVLAVAANGDGTYTAVSQSCS